MRTNKKQDELKRFRDNVLDTFKEKAPSVVQFVNSWGEKASEYRIENVEDLILLIKEETDDDKWEKIYKYRKLDYSYIKPYHTSGEEANIDEIKEKIKKDIENAKIGIYHNIYNSCHKYIGDVTDCFNVHLDNANNGNLILNGIVVGEKGSVKLQSIIASGPIQTEHIRVLVHPL